MPMMASPTYPYISANLGLYRVIRRSRVKTIPTEAFCMIASISRTALSGRRAALRGRRPAIAAEPMPTDVVCQSTGFYVKYLLKIRTLRAPLATARAVPAAAQMMPGQKRLSGDLREAALLEVFRGNKMPAQKEIPF